MAGGKTLAAEEGTPPYWFFAGGGHASQQGLGQVVQEAECGE